MIYRDDQDALDPGIRLVVQLLNLWGFETTDSGDGVTKVGTMDCALPFPNVAISLDVREDLVNTANRLAEYLTLGGVVVKPQGEDPAAQVAIQASYDPADGSKTLMLTGLDDTGLTTHLRKQLETFQP